uniref:GCS light chain n=1 Tax=Biomphalaria glabrata TaxID=6526 RepID=A0A2C9KXA7_BIOGL
MSTKSIKKTDTDILTNQFSSIRSSSWSTTRMATDKIPLFPKAKSMLIHSGNIINWNRLKRKPNQNSTDEVLECIGNTLGAYLESANKTDLQYVQEIYKVNTENVQVLDENERDDVKITVKVFICSPQPPKVITEVVDKVLNELGTSFVETLLLSIAPFSEEEEADSSVVTWGFSPCRLSVAPPWNHLEVELDRLRTVKPSIDQVNLESCCIMPKDLTEYAKSINVQLLTHNDRPVFIPTDKLKETLLSVSTERDSENWNPEWAARYSGILKCRGIISMKGYIFHATRNRKH